MIFSHYTTSRRPVDVIMNFVHEAWNQLEQQFRESSARYWSNPIPGGSFAYQDENAIKLEFHNQASPPLDMSFDDGDMCLLGLMEWILMWREGSRTVPGVEIHVTGIHDGDLMAGKLEFAVQSANMSMP